MNILLQLSSLKGSIKDRFSGLRTSHNISKYLLIGLVFGYLIKNSQKFWHFILKNNNDSINSFSNDFITRISLTDIQFWLFELFILGIVVFKYLKNINKRSRYVRNGLIENLILAFIGFLFWFTTNPKILLLVCIAGFTLIFLLFFREIASLFKNLFYSILIPFEGIAIKILVIINKTIKSNNSKTDYQSFDDPLQTIEQLNEIDAGTGLFEKYISNITNFKRLIVNNESNNHSYVICINAGWGVGKTSYINMVKNSIEILSYKDRLIWIDYSPWHFSNSTELIRDFFETLNKKMKDRYGVDILPKNQTNIYINLVTPTLEGISGQNGPDLNLFQYISSIFIKEKTLVEFKSKIKEALKKIPDKIVILIDDIDRMEPEEVITILKLVRLLSDFPKVVFILPFDYERVSSLLSRHFTEDYRGYLQKIVNKIEPLGPYSYSQLLRILEHSSEKDNKNNIVNKTTQLIFDSVVLEVRAREIETYFIKRNPENDSEFSDPLFLDFKKLFTIYFGNDGLADFWNKHVSNNRGKQNFLRNKVIEYYQRLSDRKYKDVLAVIEAAHSILRMWADYKFLKRWNEYIQEEMIIPNHNSPRQNIEAIRKDVDKIRDFSNSLVNMGLWKNDDPIFTLISKLKDIRSPIFSMNSENFSKIYKLAAEADEHITYYGDITRNNTGAIFEINQEDLRSWVINNLIKPRDIKIISNEIIKDQWHLRPVSEIYSYPQAIFVKQLISKIGI